VRRHAIIPDDSTSGVPPLIASMRGGQRTRQSNGPLQVDVHPTNQPKSTPGGQPSEILSPRSPQGSFFPTQPRSATPDSLFDCNGWCGYSQAADLSPGQTVVSIKGPI